MNISLCDEAKIEGGELVVLAEGCVLRRVFCFPVSTFDYTVV